MASRDDDSLPVRKGLARVHIYGAGIAGLTAAHELALRGFRVRVIECAQEFNETGRLEGMEPEPLITLRYKTRHNDVLAVGGMARTQFLRADKGALGNFREDGRFARCDEFRYFYKYPEGYRATEEDLYYSYEDDDRLYFFMVDGGFFRTEQMAVLQIRTPVGEDDTVNARHLSNARFMRKALMQTHQGWAVDPARVVVVGKKEAAQLEALHGAPLPPTPEGKEGLMLELQHFLPGEHGFRFFPSYYRNLFSTMVETPLLDEEGRLTGRRVFDNLEPSSFYGIASQGRRIRFLRRAPATRPVQLLQELKDLASSGYPATDALQFTLRIWRYMCTCSERRKAEYERISWWEYLEGYDPKTGTRRYQYSKDFKRDMQFAPRVLAAFDGAWGDARTNGNTLVQLYLNNLLPMPKTDGTLNGPTTLTWLRPWRRYLEKSLGVEFRLGKLESLELEEEGLVAWWHPGNAIPVDKDAHWYDPMSESGAIEPVDYYLVATDAGAAEHVTRKLPPVGVVQGLRGFTTRIPPNPRGPEPSREREDDVLPGREPWDRFQTLTGIQFFFPGSFRLAEGYIYFLDAPWGLSAINSQQYWTTPPIFSRDGFGALMSVDIGNWYVREPGQKSPSESGSPRELAQEVWTQIKTATELHNAPLPHAAGYGFELPEPAWFHVDRNIEFGKDSRTGRVRPVKNLAPYLIPIMGDWDNRPGPEPWDPLVPSPRTTETPGSPGEVWQAPHGGYPVHWGKLVFAGTYLKTFTRMTTMESANESARHAVNAIMDHYLAFRYSREAAASRPWTRAMHEVPRYGEQGTLTGSPEFRMTPIGEYCRIWDPEKHELPELAPLRELDAKLFAAGLPHVWDVLRLEPLLLPLVSPLDPMHGAESLKSFLSRSSQGLETLLKTVMPGMQWPPR